MYTAYPYPRTYQSTIRAPSMWVWMGVAAARDISDERPPLFYDHFLWDLGVVINGRDYCTCSRFCPSFAHGPHLMTSCFIQSCLSYWGFTSCYIYVLLVRMY